MDKNQKIIIALLIIAIVFSALSIYFSVSVSDVAENVSVVKTEGDSAGGVSLNIESGSVDGGVENG